MKTINNISQYSIIVIYCYKMTQTIPYREGKHFGTLSLDMNDPEDAIFIEQFKRIPSKNRDYIAALYAREKRRGVNRHVGDHIQPLSLTKQMDNFDMQKTNLNIDKNALQSSLEYIEKRTKEINQELDTEQDSKKRESMELELKSLSAEREKIKARADELGIKIAALSAKSSTDSSSPLKPDQLLTIIKKLQEQGNGRELSSVLSKIENLRVDSGGMMNYISALIDIIDKTFIYANGNRLGLSKTETGLDLLNKVMSDRRITKNKTQTKQEINNALATILNIYNAPSTAITTRAGIDMSLGVATALFRRLFGSLLMAIDFDFKDTDFTDFSSEFIDISTVTAYLKEIRSAVDNSMHIYTELPRTNIPDRVIQRFNEIATKIITVLTEQAEAITGTDFGKNKSSFGLNLCAVLLGITKSEKNDGFTALYQNLNKEGKIGELINYYDSSNIGEAFKIIQAATNNNNNYSRKTTIPRAFGAVRAAVENINKELNEIKKIAIRYNQYRNNININNRTLLNIFKYEKPDSGAKVNTISTGITKEEIIELLKTAYYRQKTIGKHISEQDDKVSISPEIPEEEEDMETKPEEEEEEEAKPDEEETRFEEEEQVAKPRPKIRIKKVDNFGEGIAGYIKIIDRGNPLKRRYR